MKEAAVFSLAGETALITGGATGIGFGIARSFTGAGGRVALVGRRDEELARAASELGPAARTFRGDVTAARELPALVQRIEAELGPLTILVNNAGNHLKKPALEVTEEEFTQVMRTHVGGAFQLTRAVAGGMVARRRGSILFIASMTSLFGIPQVVAYAAAKSAVIGLVRSLTVEFAPHGVRVNAVAPGWIQTPMLDKALHGDSARRDKILNRTPMGRFGDIEDIGAAALYLCSPAARFVTGVILPVDGGASIGF
jgi:gluconate 5-dehydrogenase